MAVSPWLYSLGIAHFVVHYEAPVKGIQLSFWAFPQDTDKGPVIDDLYNGSVAPDRGDAPPRR